MINLVNQSTQSTWQGTVEFIKKIGPHCVGVVFGILQVKKIKLGCLLPTGYLSG